MQYERWLTFLLVLLPAAIGVSGTIFNRVSIIPCMGSKMQISKLTYFVYALAMKFTKL